MCLHAQEKGEIFFFNALDTHTQTHTHTLTHILQQGAAQHAPPTHVPRVVSILLRGSTAANALLDTT